MDQTFTFGETSTGDNFDQQVLHSRSFSAKFAFSTPTWSMPDTYGHVELTFQKDPSSNDYLIYLETRYQKIQPDILTRRFNQAQRPPLIPDRIETPQVPVALPHNWLIAAPFHKISEVNPQGLPYIWNRIHTGHQSRTQRNIEVWDGGVRIFRYKPEIQLIPIQLLQIQPPVYLRKIHRPGSNRVDTLIRLPKIGSVPLPVSPTIVLSSDEEEDDTHSATTDAGDSQLEQDPEAANQDRDLREQVDQLHLRGQLPGSYLHTPGTEAVKQKPPHQTAEQHLAELATSKLRKKKEAKRWQWYQDPQPEPTVEVEPTQQARTTTAPAPPGASSRPAPSTSKVLSNSATTISRKLDNHTRAREVRAEREADSADSWRIRNHHISSFTFQPITLPKSASTGANLTAPPPLLPGLPHPVPLRATAPPPAPVQPPPTPIPTTSSTSQPRDPRLRTNKPCPKSKKTVQQQVDQEALSTDDEEMPPPTE